LEAEKNLAEIFIVERPRGPNFENKIIAKVKNDQGKNLRIFRKKNLYCKLTEKRLIRLSVYPDEIFEGLFARSVWFCRNQILFAQEVN